jgi:hypothetical protein
MPIAPAAVPWVKTASDSAHKRSCTRRPACSSIPKKALDLCVRVATMGEWMVPGPRVNRGRPMLLTVDEWCVMEVREWLNG